MSSFVIPASIEELAETTFFDQPFPSDLRRETDGTVRLKGWPNPFQNPLIKAYIDRYGLDALRWYLLTQGPLRETDADFSYAKFVEVFNADLANGIGNCASRVGNMVEMALLAALMNSPARSFGTIT